MTATPTFLDYDLAGQKLPTSTPHQPATARFVPVLQVYPGECWWMHGSKLSLIKGLARKLLKCISYWNRSGFGS